MCKHARVAYLVCFVIVLRIVLEDQWLLLVIKVLDQIVDTATKLFPPLLTFDEPTEIVRRHVTLHTSYHVPTSSWTVRH